jgi:hypothetical protein
MSRRLQAAVAILVLWLAGLGFLAKRELFRPIMERFQAAAFRIAPGAAYYAVYQGDRQIGFASSSIDTLAREIVVTDFLVANVPVGKARRRATATTRVHLTRGLRLTRFEAGLDFESGPVRVTGEIRPDSTLVLAISANGEPADTQYVRLAGPVLLPTLLPLAVALGAEPEVGREYVLPVFDPASMGSRDVRLGISAESLFVLVDSARIDAASKRWVPALTDTVRAWQVAATDGGGFSGWVDAHGRVVEGAQLGLFTLKRTAYEIAFHNWRASEREHPPTVARDDDILESTAIAASAPIDRELVRRLRVRLADVALDGYDLAGERQRLVGDTLTVTRERLPLLHAGYRLGRPPARRFERELAPEPLVQVRHPAIELLARRLAGDEQDPRVVAERINAWVHDSVEKHITVGIPSAVQVLRSRRGDCNEHTQLYIALARAAGIPARSASGLALVDGKFYYHAWPEVWLGSWIAVDPTFGQFPADAAHLRFVTGGLAQQERLLRLIGHLNIEILGTE